MNLKPLLATAAILITFQAYAMEPAFGVLSCNHEAGDCPGAGSGTGGQWLGSSDYGDGGRTDFYSDSLGEWWVTTFENGNMQVGTADDYGTKSAMKIIKPQQRPNFKAMQMTKGPFKSFATSKQAAQKAAELKLAKEKFEQGLKDKKAAADKAAADKAAADKVIADKAAADAANKAAAVYNGPAISTQPTGTGKMASPRVKS